MIGRFLDPSSGISIRVYMVFSLSSALCPMLVAHCLIHFDLGLFVLRSLFVHPGKLGFDEIYPWRV